MKNTLMIWSQLLTFFTSVAEIVPLKIKFSNKSFWNFLPLEINYSFKITSTYKEEIYKISSLNTTRSCGPNSIPTKVLHLLQDQISNHLATISIFVFEYITKIINKTIKLISG